MEEGGQMYERGDWSGYINDVGDIITDSTNANAQPRRSSVID